MASFNLTEKKKYKTAYKTVDLSKGVNQDCLKAKPLGWPCFFAPVY